MFGICDRKIENMDKYIRQPDCDREYSRKNVIAESKYENTRLLIEKDILRCRSLCEYFKQSCAEFERFLGINDHVCEEISFTNDGNIKDIKEIKESKNIECGESKQESKEFDDKNENIGDILKNTEGFEYLKVQLRRLRFSMVSKSMQTSPQCYEDISDIVNEEKIEDSMNVDRGSLYNADVSRNVSYWSSYSCLSNTDIDNTLYPNSINDTTDSEPFHQSMQHSRRSTSQGSGDKSEMAKEYNKQPIKAMESNKDDKDLNIRSTINDGSSATDVSLVPSISFLASNNSFEDISHSSKTESLMSPNVIEVDEESDAVVPRLQEKVDIVMSDRCSIVDDENGNCQPELHCDMSHKCKEKADNHVYAKNITCNQDVSEIFSPETTAIIDGREDEQHQNSFTDDFGNGDLIEQKSLSGEHIANKGQIQSVDSLLKEKAGITEGSKEFSRNLTEVGKEQMGEEVKINSASQQSAKIVERSENLPRVKQEITESSKSLLEEQIEIHKEQMEREEEIKPGIQLEHSISSQKGIATETEEQLEVKLNVKRKRRRRQVLNMPRNKKKLRQNNLGDAKDFSEILKENDLTKTFQAPQNTFTDFRKEPLSCSIKRVRNAVEKQNSKTRNHLTDNKLSARIRSPLFPANLDMTTNEKMEGCNIKETVVGFEILERITTTTKKDDKETNLFQEKCNELLVSKDVPTQSMELIPICELLSPQDCSREVKNFHQEKKINVNQDPSIIESSDSNVSNKINTTIKGESMTSHVQTDSGGTSNDQLSMMINPGTKDCLSQNESCMPEKTDLLSKTKSLTSENVRVTRSTTKVHLKSHLNMGPGNSQSVKDLEANKTLVESRKQGKKESRNVKGSEKAKTGKKMNKKTRGMKSAQEADKNTKQQSDYSMKDRSKNNGHTHDKEESVCIEKGRTLRARRNTQKDNTAEENTSRKQNSTVKTRTQKSKFSEKIENRKNDVSDIGETSLQSPDGTMKENEGELIELNRSTHMKAVNIEVEKKRQETGINRKRRVGRSEHQNQFKGAGFKAEKIAKDENENCNESSYKNLDRKYAGGKRSLRKRLKNQGSNCTSFIDGIKNEKVQDKNTTPDKVEAEKGNNQGEEVKEKENSSNKDKEDVKNSQRKLRSKKRKQQLIKTESVLDNTNVIINKTNHFIETNNEENNSDTHGIICAADGLKNREMEKISEVTGENESRCDQKEIMPVDLLLSNEGNNETVLDKAEGKCLIVPEAQNDEQDKDCCEDEKTVDTKRKKINKENTSNRSASLVCDKQELEITHKRTTRARRKERNIASMKRTECNTLHHVPGGLIKDRPTAIDDEAIKEKTDDNCRTAEKNEKIVEKDQCSELSSLRKNDDENDMIEKRQENDEQIQNKMEKPRSKDTPDKSIEEGGEDLQLKKHNDVERNSHKQSRRKANRKQDRNEMQEKENMNAQPLNAEKTSGIKRIIKKRDANPAQNISKIPEKKRRALFNKNNSSLLSIGFQITQDTTLNATSHRTLPMNRSVMPQTLQNFLQSFVPPKVKKSS